VSDWLAIGPPDNWKIGVKRKVWAVGIRLSNSWAKVEPSDRVFFYAKPHQSKAIGLGEPPLDPALQTHAGRIRRGGGHVCPALFMGNGQG
jgi:hypothetical protein